MMMIQMETAAHGPFEEHPRLYGTHIMHARRLFFERDPNYDEIHLREKILGKR